MDALLVGIVFGGLSFLIVMGGMCNANVNATRACMVAPMYRLRTAFPVGIVIGGVAYLAGLWVTVLFYAFRE